MLRSIFGSKVVKINVEDTPNSNRDPWAAVEDRETGFVVLPYALAPAGNTQTIAQPTVAPSSIDNDKIDYLSNVPFKLSPKLDHSDSGKSDLEILLIKVNSILERNPILAYDYSFALEQSILQQQVMEI